MKEFVLFFCFFTLRVKNINLFFGRIYGAPICLWFYLTFSSAQKDFKMNVAELCIIKKFGFTWNNVQTYYLSVILAQVWCIIMYYLQHIQSNLALRNFLVTAKKFLKVKSSLFQTFNQSTI